MSEHLDDATSSAVPDDALRRARAARSARLRRRYTIAGGVAAALLAAGALPFVISGDGRTAVDYADQTATTTEPESHVTSATSTTLADEEPKTAPVSLVPQGLFATVDKWGTERAAAVVMRYDGSGRRILLRSEESLTPYGIEWSPDRSKLAVTVTSGTTSRRAVPVRLDVVDLASGGVTTVFRSQSGSGFSFVGWSPDGSQIALTTGEVTTSGVGMATSTSVRPTELVIVERREARSAATGEAVHDVHWSPDGEWLGFRDGDTEGALRVVRSSGGPSRDLVAEAGSWSWSPHSDWIAFTTGGEVEVIRVEGSGRRVLADPSDAAGWVEDKPTWSPDGTHILVNRTRAGGDTGSDQAIAVVDFAGTGGCT